MRAEPDETLALENAGPALDGRLSGAPTSGRMAFSASRSGSELGAHELTFTRRGSEWTVDIAIDYAVKIAFVTVFRYKLRGRETWVDGRLREARARTDNNGKPGFLNLRRLDGGEIEVDGSFKGRYRTPANWLVASHWNIDQLKAPMINPQDGEILRFNVALKGESKIVDAAGRLRVGRHYALAGANPLELWYDSRDEWIALRAKVWDGSTVAYIRTA
jgi:hypothetical protein